MPRKPPEQMTAEQELRCLLKWAQQQRLHNIAAALQRVFAKLVPPP